MASPTTTAPGPPARASSVNPHASPTALNASAAAAPSNPPPNPGPDPTPPPLGAGIATTRHGVPASSHRAATAAPRPDSSAPHGSGRGRGLGRVASVEVPSSVIRLPSFNSSPRAVAVPSSAYASRRPSAP
eukprot:31085-Pelagococcus_subviridis.AAC.25